MNKVGHLGNFNCFNLRCLTSHRREQTRLIQRKAEPLHRMLSIIFIDHTHIGGIVNRTRDSRRSAHHTDLSHELRQKKRKDDSTCRNSQKETTDFTALVSQHMECLTVRGLIGCRTAKTTQRLIATKLSRLAHRLLAILHPIKALTRHVRLLFLSQWRHGYAYYTLRRAVFRISCAISFAASGLLKAWKRRAIARLLSG